MSEDRYQKVANKPIISCSRDENTTKVVILCVFGKGNHHCLVAKNKRVIRNKRQRQEAAFGK